MRDNGNRTAFKALLAGAALSIVAASALAAEPTGWDLLMDGAPAVQAQAALQKELDSRASDAGAAYGLALLEQARGEREKAVVTAVEGLKHAGADPLAFLLQDMISEDAVFNEATTRLVNDSLPLLTADRDLDPMVRLNLRWLGYQLAARSGGSVERLRAMAEAGFPPGAYFSPPQTEQPRINFYEVSPAEKGTLQGEAWRYSRLDGPEIRPPLYDCVPDRESNQLILLPFNVDRDVEALLYFNASKSFRVSLDDAPLLTKDIFKVQENPTSVVKVRLRPGHHRLVIKLHTQRGGEGIHMALLDTRGNALAVSWIATAAPPSTVAAGFVNEGPFEDAFTKAFPQNDPRRPGFVALWNRWQGDVARGRLLMDAAASSHPKSLPWNLWAAKMYLLEADDLPSKIAQSRADRSVERILAAEPDLPLGRYLKAMIQSTNSDSDDYLVTLRDLTRRAPSDPRWFLTLAEKLEDKGWHHQARVFLEEASSYHPACESVESAWIAFCRRVPDLAGEAEAIARLGRLRNVDPEREAYLEAARKYADLHALLEDESRRYGDRDRLFEMQLARLEIRMGDYPAARARLEGLVKLNPKDLDAAFYLARSCFLGGDRQGGLDAWSALKKIKPDAFQVDMAHWLLGAPLPFQDRHVSLAEVLKENEGKPADAAPSSLLLDQLFTRVEPDGSSIERYHGIVRINNKEGVDREGEQSLPGQIVLSLRTVKPDGRVLEPEQIPDKDTVSMQGLEAGDVIEYEYITLKPPSGVKRNAYITTQVYLFQDIEKPFHHTEWSMEYPSTMPMRFYEQNLPSPPESGARDGLATKTWDYRDMPRIAPEPDTPNKLLYVPLVEAVGGVTWKDLGLYLKEGATGVFQVTPEVEVRYRQAVGDAKTPEAKLDAIVAYLLKEVDGEQMAGWQDPTQTLLTRQGSRIPPACAFLTLAGIPFRVLVAEAIPDKVYREDLPRLGQFSVPVLEVDLPGAAPRYLTLSSPYRDPDTLPWFLQGASAMVVTAAEPWKEVQIPSHMAPWADAHETQTREILPDGDMKLTQVQVMDPESGEGLRSTFHKMDKEQMPKAIQMALSRQYGSADLEDYHVDNLDDAHQPLVWSYTVLVHGYASVDGKRLTVADPIPSLHVGQGFASLGERKLPLTTGGPIFINQHFTVTLPEGCKVDYVPPSADLVGPFGEYHLKGQLKDGKLVLDRRLTVPFQIVWPKDYPAFAAFMKKIDAAEGGQMTLILK